MGLMHFLQHRCHSYAQKDAPEAFTSGAADSVRIPTAGQECCRSMPLTLPPMRVRLKVRRGSKKQAQAQKAEVDAAEWISRVVKDPMVEIDPVTMIQHLLVQQDYASVAAHTVVESNSPAPVVATSQQPFSHFAMAPKGLVSILLALGAAIALASLSAAVHLLRSGHQQRKLEVVAEQHAAPPLTYASSDEQGKLDLLSIVEQEEQLNIREKPTQDMSPKPEVLISAAANLLVQEAVAAAQVISKVGLSPKPGVVKAPAAEVQGTVAAAAPLPQVTPRPEVVKAAAETIQVQEAAAEAPHVVPRPEVVKAAAETIQVQEAVAAAQVIGKVEQAEPPHPKPEVVIAAAAQAIEIEKSVEAEFNDEGHVNKVVVTDVVVDKRVAITAVHSMANWPKIEEQASSAVNPVPSLLDSTAAPEKSLNDNKDHLSVPLDHGRSMNLSDHFFKNSYLTFPSFDTQNFMRVRFSSRTGNSGKDDLQDETIEEDEMIYDEEKREALKRIVQAAVPAMAVGAGAMSVLTGVDGAFEMVGLAATASFVSFELLWAETREELWREVKKISDHKKLLEFFKARKIIQPDNI